MERKNAWTTFTEKQLEELEKLSKSYRNFLDEGKTERECTTYAIKEAEAKGYKNLDELIKSGAKLKAGDKVYRALMGKTVVK